MHKRLAHTALITALVLGTAGTAHAYPIAKGTNEIRPLIGATANIEGQRTQFQMGVDWNISLTGPLGFVLGTWVGFGESFIGLEVHAGVKYRFLSVHPRVAPFIAGGAGFTSGFFTQGPSDAITGLGFRFGTGVDFFATRRIVPGFQIMFDLGPRFTPTVGFLGSVQVTFGCSFLL